MQPLQATSELVVLTCHLGHQLLRFEAGANREKRGSDTRDCDHCKSSFNENTSAGYICEQVCDYDCCVDCFTERSGTNLQQPKAPKKIDKKAFKEAISELRASMQDK